MVQLNPYLKLMRIEGWGYSYMSVIGLIIAVGLARPFWEIMVFMSMVFAYLGFCFAINQSSDIEEDRLNKCKKNPVAMGELSKKNALIFTSALAVIGILLSAFFGPESLLFYSLLLFLGFIYSWPPIRLKSRFLLDSLSHGLFFGAGLFLMPFVAFGVPVTGTAYGIALVIFYHSLTRQLQNHIWDYEGDKKANLRTTACVLGKETTEKILASMVVLFPIVAYLAIPDRLWFLVMLAVFGFSYFKSRFMPRRSGS